jgi:ribulose-phosphate 3-epimerase
MIIPALLTTQSRIAEERIRLAQSMSGWLHIDFLDQTLYPFTSLAPEAFADFDFGNVLIEAHAMTTTPTQLLEYNLPIERILLHYELPNWRKGYDAILAAEREAWLVIDATTDMNNLDLPPDLMGVVIMGVLAGQSGQPFRPQTYERVERFKDRYPDIAVTVDGGVSLDTTRLLIAHGADNLVAGSAIFGQVNPVAAYDQLVMLADPLGRKNE